MPEKLAKIASLRKRACVAEQEVAKLKERIHKLTEKEGEVIDSSLHSDMVQIMRENTDTIKSTYPEGSFARLLWEEQLKATTQSSSKHVRWHPTIIKWCLNLKLLSSSTYHALRTSGFLKLPLERTLRDYTHYFDSKPGFQDEVDHQLAEEANLASLPESRKYVAILIDEMKIKEGLVYNKVSEEIVGFINQGDINDDLLKLEQRGEHPPIAKYVLVLMVRGLLFKLVYPYGHFGTSGVSGDLLYPIVWEAIRRLEANGLKMLCITADGASSNRKFFRMHHDEDGSTLKYKTKNPFAADERWICFISDPPHLVKTVHNCWSNSGVKGTRRMKV